MTNMINAHLELLAEARKGNITLNREVIQRFRYNVKEMATDPLESKERFAKVVRESAENGEVAVVTQGMDCDCSQYVYSFTMEAVPTIVRRYMNSAYDGADGPMGCSVCKPSERPESYSRDLAMEAYENGHPHYITAAW